MAPLSMWEFLQGGAPAAPHPVDARHLAVGAGWRQLAGRGTIGQNRRPRVAAAFREIYVSVNEARGDAIGGLARSGGGRRADLSWTASRTRRSAPPRRSRAPRGTARARATRRRASRRRRAGSGAPPGGARRG